MIRRFGIRGLAVGLFAACAAMVAAPAAQADPTGAMSTLTAESGQGTGLVIVSPTSAGQGNFVAQLKINIHGAPRTPPSALPDPLIVQPMVSAAPISSRSSR